MKGSGWVDGMRILVGLGRVIIRERFGRYEQRGCVLGVERFMSMVGCVRVVESISHVVTRGCIGAGARRVSVCVVAGSLMVACTVRGAGSE